MTVHEPDPARETEWIPLSCVFTSACLPRLLMLPRISYRLNPAASPTRTSWLWKEFAESVVDATLRTIGRLPEVTCGFAKC